MGNFGNIGANPNVPLRVNEPPGYSPGPTPGSPFLYTLKIHCIRTA